MLVSDTLKKLERVVNKIDNNNEVAELYAHINHDLAHIAQGLKSDLKTATKELDNKVIMHQREFQNATNEWVKKEIETLNEIARGKHENLLTSLFNTIAEKITQELQEKITQTLANLHEKIDLQTLLSYLKNDENLIQSIKTESINKALESLQNEKDSILQEVRAALLHDLQNKTDINEIIKQALQSKEIINAILSQIGTKLKEAIQDNLKDIDIVAEARKELENLQTALEKNTLTAQEAGERFATFLHDMQAQAVTRLQEYKEMHLQATKDLESTKEAQIIYIQAQAEVKKQELEAEITEYFHTFLEQEKSDFTTLKQNALNEIVGYISALIYTDEFAQNIHTELLSYGIQYLKEGKEILESAIIEATKNELLASITNERLRAIILGDEAVVKNIYKAGFAAARDKLDNITMREFVESALRLKAEEILSNDEFLRANAEAQAHLLAMRLQSQLESLESCLKELEKESDYTAQLEVIAAQKAALEHAIKEAQQNLTNFLQSQAIKDFIQDSMNKNQTNLESFLTQELQKIAQDLEQNLQNLPDLHTAKIATLEAIIKTQDSKIQDLEKSLQALTKELENFMQNNQNISPQNPNTQNPNTQNQTQNNTQQTQEKHKKLAWN